MPSRSGPSLLLIAVLSVATLALSAFAFTQEVTHFTAAGMSDEERIAAFVAGDRVPGLSSQSQVSYMLDCRNSIVSPVGLSLPPERKAQLYSACLSAARSIADANPGSSLAWLSAAHASLALADYPAMNQFLAKSYQAGKNEGWVAKLRVELVELNFGRFDQAMLPQHRADLALLIGDRDMPMVAGIYARYPSSRERITSVAETLPAAAQGPFLSSVSRAMTELKSDD